MRNILRILVFFFYYWEGSLGFPHISLSDDCPSDCICYSDYLHNQESWKWVESDLLSEEDDPEHERFNPYMEHNEVFENPKLQKRRQTESILSTVTCMLRQNDSTSLETLFTFIPRHTQVLSLIQAPGSSRIYLTNDLLKNFHSLLGLEIKGYNDQQDMLEISGDCFKDLNSLTYLSLEKVLLQQASVENQIHDSSRLLRINYTFNDIVTNEMTSQILILKEEDDSEDNLDGLLSYSEYKKSSQKEKTAPLEPKFRVAFTGLPKLQHLKITGCNLHDISWDIFHKLENLKFLLLDENDLLFLPDFVFYATSNLTVLSLSGNRILNLQTVGLAGLLYLQKLDVSNNNITHLSELSLPPFPHLEIADFRNNPITSIFPNTFEIMNSTKALYLGSPTTPLDLSPNSFFGLASLQKLQVTNVKIRLLEKVMLKGMPNLQTLKLSGEIPRISYDAFGEVTNLEKLIMKNCGLKKISMDALFGLTSLKELDLSHNSLAFLPPGIFEDQTALVEVFLQNNQLTTLPINLFDNLSVKIIRLDGNPWHCTCEMKSWNPQKVNRVKRYHIPAPNNTLCQKMYDKGSMCFETYEPKFEPTYSYEKRVSPVCETPMKFNHRSVFQVLRKELKYCKETSQNGELLQGQENLNQSERKSPSYPENYSINTLKALEKQLMAKPIKVKKKNRTSQQSSYMYEQSLIPIQIAKQSQANDILPLQENLHQTFNEFISPVSIPKIPDTTILQFSASHIQNESVPVSHAESIPVDSNVSSNFHQSIGNGTEIVISPIADKFAWIQSLPNKLKAKNKKKKKIQYKPLPSVNVEEEAPLSTKKSIANNNNNFAPISKKSLKLAMSQRRTAL